MSKKEQNNANEPLSDYSEPVSFNQVWKMFLETDKQFKETARRFKETDKKFQETDKRMQETDKRMQETDKRMQETDKRMQETDRKIERLAKLYGGVSENSKDVAEEFFRRGLEARNALFGIEYTEVDHLARTSKKLQGEYDIVLHNGEYCIVIEVKYKLHPDDVADFVNRKLLNFKSLFREYAHKKILGAVAGMSVPSDSYELAAKHGLLVLTQSGDNMAVTNPEGFQWEEY
ncbi:MAG: hypothetical protein K9H65_02435 [Bacteroidales bacterium]|nr:hypothetical protein [Bacteroidales bacterium]